MEADESETAGGDAGGDAFGEESINGPEPAPMMEDPMDDEVMQLDEQSLGAFEELNSAVELADCSRAGELRERICELAERICEIAENNHRAASRCEDSEVRCATARERVADECD